MGKKQQKVVESASENEDYDENGEEEYSVDENDMVEETEDFTNVNPDFLGNTDDEESFDEEENEDEENNSIKDENNYTDQLHEIDQYMDYLKGGDNESNEKTQLLKLCVKENVQLTDQQIKQIKSDFPEYQNIMEEYSQCLVQLRERITPLMQQVKSEDYTTKEPIERKLEYQINKLLKMSKQTQEDEEENKEIQEENALDFKPQPNLLDKNITTDNFEINEDGELVEKDLSQQIYKAPKISATLSKEDRVIQKQQRDIDRKKKHLLKGNFIKSIENDLNDDKPQYESLKDIKQQVYDESEASRIRFEEENFVRLPQTKKDKIRLHKKMKKANTEYEIDDMREFENIREVLKQQGLTGNDDNKSVRKEQFKKTVQSYKLQQKNQQNQSLETEFRKPRSGNKKLTKPKGNRKKKIKK